MRPVVTYGLGVGAVAVVVFVLFVAFVSGVGGLYTHDHGTLEVSIDGERIDFDQPQYHDRHPTFHFHEGGGQEWHHHPESPLAVLEFERLSVAEALGTLEIDVTDSSVTIDGRIYEDGEPGTTVSITVDGEPADPDAHLLQDGDDVVLEVVS
ncbi:hypothetical protein [Natronorubrum texcoconense]|uniref:Uncharacterized protein n=1 Tax=Natronorubrum texcoconense TaxID=1095776 RepID=A0A1G8T2R2_9EURY|nr:hypothetical protein [Natronorubrum texcoconense]SDJ35828.1 hypothetical protein SAMN04515672_0300 [Natronorubrum texcoconense]